jgi:hypothetical protein
VLLLPVSAVLLLDALLLLSDRESLTLLVLPPTAFAGSSTSSTSC